MRNSTDMLLATLPESMKCEEAGASVHASQALFIAQEGFARYQQRANTTVITAHMRWLMKITEQQMCRRVPARLNTTPYESGAERSIARSPQQT